MINQILNNIKMHLAERQSQISDRFECTASDYSLGKLDALYELENFITGEFMHFSIDESDIYQT